MNNAIQSVAVVGAGIGGLMSALALQRYGIKVTLFERDSAPPPSISPADSMKWLRKGVPQSLHPHFLMGRLRVLLEERYPLLISQLEQAGVGESCVYDYVHPSVQHRLQPQPSDRCLRSLNTRRTTFEMTVRDYAEKLPGITLRNNAKVVGLIVEGTDPAFVRGIEISSDGQIEAFNADAVVDASGRFSRLAKSLQELGVNMDEDQRDSGIWYFTRHYRLKAGENYPQVFGLPGAVFDDFIVGALPADNDTFTITFQIYREDKALSKALRNPVHFQTVCAAINQTAPWVDPNRSEPTSDVHGFGQMDSYWRSTVLSDEPNVLGFYCVGDSCVRSNPKYGRGCTWATIAAHQLADILVRDTSSGERIKAYENSLERKFRQDWLTMRDIDRSTERTFEAAMGNRQPGHVEKMRQRFQSFINRAILTEPALFRELWSGYHGFQNMAAWTRNPFNWLRILRAWVTQHRYRDLYESQRGRPSHKTMSTSNR